MLPFDAASARRVAATYATPDVVAQRMHTLELLDVRPGERVLDVGTGPGQLLSSLADTVGRRGAAHGLDPSPSMVAMAMQRLGTAAGGAGGAGEHRCSSTWPTYLRRCASSPVSCVPAAGCSWLADVTDRDDYFFSLNRYCFRAVRPAFEGAG